MDKAVNGGHKRGFLLQASQRDAVPVLRGAGAPRSHVENLLLMLPARKHLGVGPRFCYLSLKPFLCGFRGLIHLQCLHGNHAAQLGHREKKIV